MHEPTYEELTDSIVRAANWEGLKVRMKDGIPYVVERDGAALTPPVAMQFTPDTLRQYYRKIAEDALRGRPESPWEWWMDLMSTHLGEAMYDLDRVGGPAVITIGEFGFTATPTRAD
ncbi:hypothetical protein [Nocardia sp. NPDC005745]|uniref:hypothetical protein n=1 Tax=Nocardia sp. NPDC005745 TaxID=3157061 RepID=UPI00340E7207